MKTIKISNGVNKITEEQVDSIVDYLKNGKVIAYPTDTIYGLGCDARNVKAIERIGKIKGERENKPFIVLISDFLMLENYCYVNSEQMEYLKEVWREPIPLTPLIKGAAKTPITVILECQPNLPDKLTGDSNSLAVRLPDNDFLVKIISQAGFPIVSTSLNKTGELPLHNVQNLEKYFKYLPDLVIDAGESENTKPSRLVDLRDVNNIIVIRE